MRVGIRWDLHRLKPGKPFVLGGVRLHTDRGPAGHSDGDVLAHAIVDALLGAAGLGDIGEHFPDSDPKWSGVSSVDVFLRDACTMVRMAGWSIQSVDTTVMLEGIKLKEYKPQIRSTLATKMGIDEAAVNVKAKTHEGLGEIGRFEAVAAEAIVLLSPIGGERGGAGGARRPGGPGFKPPFSPPPKGFRR